MKMCQPHWDELKAAMEERDLMQFVSKDGHVAVERMQAELDGMPEKDRFDPLMAANFAIWTNALQAGGLYLMFGKEDGGDYCPICESVAHNGPPAEWWIKNAADAELARARELGLLPPEREN